MDRRDFLKQVAMWSAGVALAKPLFRVSEAAGVQAASGPMVSVAHGKDYAGLVKQVLAPLGGMGAFVKPGQKVVVKPNIGWDRNVDQAANTHPVVVQATVREALAAGAAQVLVFDRTCNDPRRCYANSGIQAAVEAIGDKRVRCELIDDRKWVPVQIERGRSLNEWLFYKDALDADAYINLPIAKHHSGSRLTMGLKNIMGVIGGRRGEIHKDLGQRIADLNLVLRPTVTIIDATRILTAHGPQGGDLNDVKVTDTLIASRDVVAADAYATGLFSMNPSEIEAIVAAHSLGIGEMDLQKMRIVEA